VTLFKGLAVAFGWFALAAALFFLFRRVTHNAASLAQIVASLGLITYIVLGLVAASYGLALFGKGLAWGQLLGSALGRQPAWHSVISVHGRSQIYKYLPGNFFHFASRQVRGRELGWSHVDVASATTFEIILNIAAALSVGIALGSLTSLKAATEVPLVNLAVALPLLLVTAWIFVYVLPHFSFAQRFPRLLRFWSPARSAALARALVMYLLFFLAAGLLFDVVLIAAGGASSLSVVIAGCAAFSFAWIAGFVTPGAPGGLGIREALLVLLVSPSVGEPTATAAALLYRVVTLAGEFFYFLGSSVIGRRCQGGD
jgi:uncharacterized membrane protein YbhN (UPF0104 family)